MERSIEEILKNERWIMYLKYELKFRVIIVSTVWKMYNLIFESAVCDWSFENMDL